MDPDTLILGFTIEEIESATLTVLVTALILYMVFIIGNLAYKSKAANTARCGCSSPWVWGFSALSRKR